MLHRVAAYALETCLIVFCGFMIAFGQSAQPNNVAKEAIDKAQAAYLKKDYALARRELESALAIRMDLAEAHLLLGMVAWQEGKVDDAIRSLQEAVKYQPNYPDAHYVMGKLYFEMRNWKRAEEEANLALGQGSKLANLHVLLGDIALARSQFEQAVKFLEQALAQPSLNSDVANETRMKIEAVKNFVEFQANMGNKNFQFPKHTAKAQIPKPVPFRDVTVRLAGILNNQGRFTSLLVLGSSDRQMTEKYLQFAAQNQYTPATKNGAPVPIWFTVVYQTSTRIDVIR
ncbi:MAG TPA: tetratricopeptide repeat protein [Blastocatellia bacterium]|jgi:tetratricopeptide (TPR) repeat protein|nr:tetratricopeptide repeat protein [Blastocatellia bacterium]